MAAPSGLRTGYDQASPKETIELCLASSGAVALAKGDCRRDDDDDDARTHQPPRTTSSSSGAAAPAVCESDRELLEKSLQLQAQDYRKGATSTLGEFDAEELSETASGLEPSAFQILSPDAAAEYNQKNY